ncbi:MAG TPA: zinc ribbon domain-containing protein [Solirubrobacterales bacterium]|nr:zinc ribbon domain-containing protein [Solirubrobacterales bacterium]
MTDPAATTQILGKEGEPCRECGAPLAADQRYCLNCGRRRGEPRIDFESQVPPRGTASVNGGSPASSQPVVLAARQPSEEKGPQRDYTPLAAVGGIAVLGVMLLIGVLIGKGDSGGTATTPAPVVVQGGEVGSGKTAANEEAGEGKTEAKQAKAKGSKKGGTVKGGSTNTGNAPVASDEELQKLQEQSPQEYSENSAKLPDEIATGGAPPPEDGKAPGGGSKGTAIE